MFRIHRLLEGDGTGGTGDGAGTGDTGTGNAPAFDMSGIIPAGSLPAELSMYAGKTAGDVFNGVAEMRRTLTENGTKMQDQTGQIESLTQQLSDSKNAKIDSDTAPLDNSKLRETLNEYFTTGAASEEFFTAVSERGIKPDKAFMSKMMQYALEDQNRYIKKGQDFIEDRGIENMDFRSIHAFMHDADKSGFTPEQIQAFGSMMELGGDDMGWLNPVLDRFNKAIEGGYQPQQFGERHVDMPDGTFRRGRPMEADTSGFKSQAEYMTALNEAANDKVSPAAATDAVNKKLMASPQGIGKWKDRTFGGVAAGAPSD